MTQHIPLGTIIEKDTGTQCSLQHYAQWLGMEAT